MPSTPANSERRKKLRKRPLRLVYIELASGNGGMMRDLSEEGFAVRAMMPVKQGQETTFSFTLGDATHIAGEGKVLWIGEGGRVAGVRFTQIGPQMRSQIDDWLIEDEKVSDAREAGQEPAIPPASSMEELRKEIRSTPVRGELAAPALEEQPRIEEHGPTPLAAAKIPEPQPAELPGARAEVSIATPEASGRRDEVVAKDEPRPVDPSPPRPVSEPRVAPVPAASEGLFRKWPKAASPSPETVATSAPGLAPVPRPTPVASSGHFESQQVEEDDGQEVGTGLPQPDISEILIQPRGLSAEITVRPLAEPAELPRARASSGERFTLERAILIMVVLTTLVGLLVYHQAVGDGLIWLGEALGGTSSNAASPPSVSGSDPDRVSTGGDNGPAPPTRSAKEAQNPAVPPSSTASGAPALTTPPKGTAAPVTPLSSPEASPDAGQSEYLQAVQLMRGRNAGNDAAEAVRLLWIAVEKGNPSAEVSLADLYWHGQGVLRNCDQARILFTAAARKGSSEAQRRLQQFQQQGCE